jgi:excisionase family DNA binding protein
MLWPSVHKASDDSRFEPVTSGVTAHRASRPERSTVFNPLTSLGSGEGEGVRNSRPFTRFPEAFGPTLVQGERKRRFKAARKAGTLLKVREVAASLSVSTATVYGLCDRGELAHVRVSGAIRVRREDLEALLEVADPLPRALAALRSAPVCGGLGARRPDQAPEPARRQDEGEDRTDAECDERPEEEEGSA